MYGKVFPEMYTGSMVGAGCHVFAVWGYALATSDEKGYVELNPRLLAMLLGASDDQMQDAIDVLMQPDANSRSKEEDGRRLIREGQFLYRIVNHGKYRDIRDKEDRRRYQREWDRKNRPSGHKRAKTPQSDNSPTRSDKSDQSRSRSRSSKPPCGSPKGNLSKSSTTGCQESFAKFWSVWPKKVDKVNARKVFANLNADDKLLNRIIVAVEAWKLSPDWMKEDGQYIPSPAKWLRNERWEDEIKTINDSANVAGPVRDADGMTPRERLLAGRSA